MKTIAEHVREHITSDLVAYEALQRGILNLTAYGRGVKKAIEAERLEKTDLGTLTVALSRLRGEIQAKPPLTPKLALKDLTLQAPLCDITYAKHAVSDAELEAVSKLIRSDSKDFTAITQAYREVTIIAPSRLRAQVEQTIKRRPDYVQDGLFAASVHFSIGYLQVPNVIYALLASLAAHQVNIVEVISTGTELSIIITKDDVDTATQALQQFL